MLDFLPNLLSLEIMVVGLYILSVYNFFKIRTLIKHRTANPAQFAASSALAPEYSSSLRRKREVA